MITSVLKRIISLLVATVMLVPPTVQQSVENCEKDKVAQLEHIAALEEAYLSGKAPKVNETDFVDGDLDSALKSGLKFNELSFVATHNSYQTRAADSYCEIFDNLSALTFDLVSGKTGEYCSQTLTEQFNCGIRSIELDIEPVEDGDAVSFTCMHMPYLDSGTTCYDLALALKEIKMWSDYNPNHLPITIIIEPKRVFVPMENMKFMNIDYALALDEMLRDVLGDKLFEPADMLRDYDSFAEMRFADDWCEAEDMLGKVLVLLHDTAVTEEYIALDESIKTQAMFPMLRYDDKDLSYASFLLINDPTEALEASEEIIGEYNLIVRTQVDTFTSVSQEKRENAMLSGAQILSTDYPVRNDLTAESYAVSFDNSKTVRINNF